VGTSGSKSGRLPALPAHTTTLAQPLPPRTLCQCRRSLTLIAIMCPCVRVHPPWTWSARGTWRLRSDNEWLPDLARQRLLCIAGTSGSRLPQVVVPSPLVPADSNKRKSDPSTPVASSNSVHATTRQRSASHRRCCESARSSGGRRSCRSDDRDSDR
jgi:hypothetical protein